MGRSAKLNALRHIAMTLGEGSLIPLLSFMAGRLDRIHFVKQLEGAKQWVHLSGNLRLWPRTPFRAQIDGADIQNPITFIDIAALRDDELFVKVDLATNHEPEWYRDVLEDEPEDPKTRLQDSMNEVREKTNLALDAYRTANEEISGAGEDEKEYLVFVLEQAKEDMRTLNAELSRLETLIRLAD